MSSSIGVSVNSLYSSFIAAIKSSIVLPSFMPVPAVPDCAWEDSTAELITDSSEAREELAWEEELEFPQPAKAVVISAARTNANTFFIFYLLYFLESDL